MKSARDELQAIESAVNSAVGYVRGIWIAFISLGTYLVIAVGSVTHRMLFLETPIKLPVLNVELPLVGFFVVAPIFFLIVHFYSFLQLIALSRKIALYNETLARAFGNKSERRKRQYRLDLFVFVQLLAGTPEERAGLNKLLLNAVVLFTMAIAPVLLLLQIELTFLPYHREDVTWLHRAVIFIDLALIWFFWPAVRRGIGELSIRPMLRQPMVIASSAFVVIFSVCIATYPGERIHGNVISKLADLLEWAREGDRPIRVSERVFGTQVNDVTGSQRGLFSNVIVAPNQDFIEVDKLDKVARTISLRGRDLRGAVLWSSDLRKADFTGANLNGARLENAKLNQARFECAETAIPLDLLRTNLIVALRSAQLGAQLSAVPALAHWPDGCTWLQGASFTGAHLQGASLKRARMQGAFLIDTQMQGASLQETHLEGAILVRTQLEGASLDAAHLQGAFVTHAKLQGASLDRAQLQGANLFQAELDGASLGSTQLLGALLQVASAWRSYGKPQSDAPERVLFDFKKRFVNTMDEYKIWRDKILNMLSSEDNRKIVTERLMLLDPSRPDPSEIIPEEEWNKLRAAGEQITAADHHAHYAGLIVILACARESSPFLARTLIQIQIAQSGNSRIKDNMQDVIDALKNSSSCPGAEELSSGDFSKLDEVDPRNAVKTKTPR